MKNFQEVAFDDFSLSPFKTIGKEWGLITAGTQQSFNTMTASWGGVGVLWNKNVLFAFIRPQRYTDEFVQNNENFTFSFYPQEYKKALSFCGANSGRDVDKVKETALTPVFSDNSVYFEQANLVFVCKKIYLDTIDKAGFLDPSLDNNYPNKDYHKVYIAEIVKILKG